MVSPEKVGTGSHRMTRKKRRAREARQMLEEHLAGEDANDNEDSGPVIPNFKKVARDHKREMAERAKEKTNRSIHDEDVERAKKKRKGVVGSDALGDSGLFSEERIAYAPKKKSEQQDEDRIESSYNFHGYDPSKDGRKKPKRKGVHKFKSKSKYKRR